MPPMPVAGFAVPLLFQFPASTRIDFSAPAILRKWPSVNKRASARRSARPYMIVDGTLDECIQKFVLQPDCSVICMKFTPRRSPIWLARYYPGITSLSWCSSGIFSENDRP
jgi:hypothetical protein